MTILEDTYKSPPTQWKHNFNNMLIDKTQNLPESVAPMRPNWCITFYWKAEDNSRALFVSDDYV